MSLVIDAEVVGVALIAAGSVVVWLLVWRLGRASDLVDELLDLQRELPSRREIPTPGPDGLELRAEIPTPGPDGLELRAVRFVWPGTAAACDRAAPGAVPAPVSGAATILPPTAEAPPGRAHRFDAPTAAGSPAAGWTGARTEDRR